MNQLEILIPINENSLTGDIQKRSLSIAKSFHRQTMTWVPRSTIQELRKVYRVEPDDENYGPESFKEFYYDKTDGLFYLSKEHAKKSKQRF